MHDHHHHDHHDDHDHHGHAHGPVAYNRAFALGIVFNAGFVAIEAWYGFASNSLALLADAGHNLSDVFSLLLSWAAFWLGQRAPTRHRTYGFGRGTILASLANAVILMIAVGAIGLEAVQRLAAPQPVASGIVIVVAAIGIAVNAATAWLFMAGSRDDLNLRGAFVHMAADAAVSLGVVCAGLLIARTGALWIDPAISLGIALVIALTTWGLLRDSLHLALDAVPRKIDRDAVEDFLAGQPGVSAVHDLHIWPLSTTSIALTVHLVRPDAAPDDDFLHEIAHALHERFDIDHATMQIECGRGNHSCPLAPDHVI